MLLQAIKYNFNSMPGRKTPDSSEPYNLLLWKMVFSYYPEDYEHLPRKLAFLCQFISPNRMTQLDKCTFENLTIDYEHNLAMFFDDAAKSGIAFLKITHYSKNPKYSLWRIFLKYIKVIPQKYRKGGFFRHYTSCSFDQNKVGYYSPNQRYKIDDFSNVRREMEATFIESHSSDIFFEEIVGVKLEDCYRSSRLSSKSGLKRFTAKAPRKTYASSNRNHPHLSDEDLARDYWRSITTFQQSYSMGDARSEQTRQSLVTDHYLNQIGGNSNFSNMGGFNSQQFGIGFGYGIGIALKQLNIDLPVTDSSFNTPSTTFSFAPINNQHFSQTNLHMENITEKQTETQSERVLNSFIGNDSNFFEDNSQRRDRQSENGSEKDKQSIEKDDDEGEEKITGFKRNPNEEFAEPFEEKKRKVTQELNKNPQKRKEFNVDDLLANL